MRHQKKPKRLLPNKRAARSNLQNLAVSLVLYEKITTTKSRAKSLKSIADRLITTAKLQNLAGRRKLHAYLPKVGAVRKLMEELGPRYSERAGGYTRIRNNGVRKGDGAQTAIIEFV